jgi:hypothetical protein
MAIRPEPSNRTWIPLAEAADLIGVVPKTIRRWIADERVIARRFGPKLIRVELESLMNMGESMGR